MVILKNDLEATQQDFVKFRQFVRVFYPQNCPQEYLPLLTIRYRNYRILDISEAGLCFQVPTRNLITEDIITGAIKFPDDSIVEFSGVVVRKIDNQIALKLVVGIPYNYIASEQVRLRILEQEGKISFGQK